MPDGHLDVEVACDELAPATARRLVDELVAGLPADARFAVRLMASELVANVVRHAGLGRADRLQLRCAVSEGRVHAEVRDRGVGYDPCRCGPPDALSGGLGLEIVRTLSTSCGIATIAGETVAWFALELPDAPDRAAAWREPVAELGSHPPGGDR